MPISVNGANGITFADGSIQNTGAAGFGFKNRIINGAMVIDQRNAGAAVTVNSTGQTYPVDRFFATGQSTDGVFTLQQSSTAPAGFVNSVVATVTTADASIGVTQNYLFRQRLEGYNIADLTWGIATAATVTLSFWVRSSLTGTFGGTLHNGNGDRFYPYSYTISAANTWEQKTITIAGDTTGTWEKTNGIGLNVIWSLGTGSTLLAPTSAWTATTYTGFTGQTNLIGTVGATFYITGVQLEKGSQATAFDWRPYTTEQLLCYRYLPVFRANENGSAYSNPIVQGSATALGTNTYMLFHHIVPTRVAPTGITISAVGDLRFSNNDGNAPCTVNAGLASAGIYQSVWTFTVASSRSGSTVPGWFYTGASGFYFYLTGCEL